jgi:hypothetical protein
MVSEVHRDDDTEKPREFGHESSLATGCFAFEHRFGCPPNGPAGQRRRPARSDGWRPLNSLGWAARTAACRESLKRSAPCKTRTGHPAEQKQVAERVVPATLAEPWSISTLRPVKQQAAHHRDDRGDQSRRPDRVGPSLKRPDEPDPDQEEQSAGRREPEPRAAHSQYAPGEVKSKQPENHRAHRWYGGAEPAKDADKKPVLHTSLHDITLGAPNGPAGQRRRPARSDGWRPLNSLGWAARTAACRESLKRSAPCKTRTGHPAEQKQVAERVVPATLAEPWSISTLRPVKQQAAHHRDDRGDQSRRPDRVGPSLKRPDEPDPDQEEQSAGRREPESRAAHSQYAPGEVKSKQPENHRAYRWYGGAEPAKDADKKPVLHTSLHDITLGAPNGSVDQWRHPARSGG